MLRPLKVATRECVPVAGPSITQKEIDYVTDAVTNCWYGSASAYHDRFEAAAAGYLGVRYAVALPSCTSAIHLALAAFDIGPGDEVVVPDITWIASAAPISYVGATPVFADVERQSWCLSPQSLEACITTRTRAVIAVDLYGNVAAMDAVHAVARRYHLAVIEDAAQAFGSTLSGRKAGTLGDVGTFSFHGSKTLTTGEGGMLVTNCERLYRRVLVLRDHGRRPGDTAFCNSEVGYKYKMSSMQAALGLAQVERAEELVSMKRRIFDWYAARLGDVPGLTLNEQRDSVRSTFWMVTAVLDERLGWDKQRLATELHGRGIDTRPFFHPLSSLPAYADFASARAAASRNPVSYLLSPHGINLPSALALTEADVDYVCTHLRHLLASP